jgi:hypothetical protein
MTITLNTNKQFKEFIEANRKSVTNINGTEFTEMYPMIEATNRAASYYDVKSQGNNYFIPPFIIKVKTN